MIILGIDPGTEKSGVVRWDSESGKVLGCSHSPNQSLVDYLRENNDKFDALGIEQIRSYRLVAGNDTIDTIWWSGRFYEACNNMSYMIPRKTKEGVVHNLCGQDGAGDSGVRAALIDRLGKQGTKKAPGPLFGMSGSHMFAALGVAVTVYDKFYK